MTFHSSGVLMNLDRDKLFDKHGLDRLRDSYMMQGESSPQERFAFVANAFSSDLTHAQRMYEYASKHWLSFATPILSFGKDKRGLPCSCYLVYMDDSREGLVNTLSETSWLSMLGGGVGIGVGIRSGGKSTGVMTHLKTYDATVLAYTQGKSRRGSYAMYLDISHPDIIQFIEMRKPTGDINRRCLNLHHGVNITDLFMNKVDKAQLDPNFDDSWDLVDPHTGEVMETVSAKRLWERLLEMRIQTGEPYFHFIDNTNNAIPQYFKDKGLFIKQSNLCIEVVQPTNKDRTAVCCLSSPNADYFDEWSKDPFFIADVVEFLDNVITYFINNAPDEIKRAKYAASMERSIGIGLLGFHSYLQSKNIPFESVAAIAANKKIFNFIKEKAIQATLLLGESRGEAPDAKGYGRRNSLLMALAPNASTSIIIGNTSPSCEPFRANAYRQDTLSGYYLNKNKHLEKLITDRCKSDIRLDADEIWSSIIAHDGSVQQLDFLTDTEKDVFKTAMEIDQMWVIQHAADRQKYIDQSQSLNIFFEPDANIKYIHACHFAAWKKGVKSLYYLRSAKISKGDRLGKSIKRVRIEDDIDLRKISEGSDCVACEG